MGRDGASEAAAFIRAGIPAVEFGPAGAGHHGPEEWVSLSGLARYRRALGDFVALALLRSSARRPAAAPNARAAVAGRSRAGWLIEGGPLMPAHSRGRAVAVRARCVPRRRLDRRDDRGRGAARGQEHRRRDQPDGPLKNVGTSLPAPGAPQTLLLIGSDHRAGEAYPSANTDTMMLVRIDDSSQTINVLSIPRDLEVELPERRHQGKLNAAYSIGGPTACWSGRSSSEVFPGLKINHILDVNFSGFAEMIDAIGCVYTDVDHRYYNNTALTDYSSIDIQPGYQKLCGDNQSVGGALAFVRFRHTDSDLVRNARQQDFIRWAKEGYSTGELLAEQTKLLHIFGKQRADRPLAAHDRRPDRAVRPGRQRKADITFAELRVPGGQHAVLARRRLRPSRTLTGGSEGAARTRRFKTPTAHRRPPAAAARRHAPAPPEAGGHGPTARASIARSRPPPG